MHALGIQASSMKHHNCVLLCAVSANILGLGKYDKRGNVKEKE
jgi:hypothetical protein